MLCGLARVEVVRAVRHHGPAAAGRARLVVERFDLVRIDDALLDATASLPIEQLNSLTRSTWLQRSASAGNPAALIS